MYRRVNKIKQNDTHAQLTKEIKHRY